MGRFDEARLALEAATGGKNTLLLDDMGLPSVMVRVPRFKWADVMEGGEDAVCSAFVVGGKVKDYIYISKYLNIIERGRAYSLPARDPAHTLAIGDARAACALKGPGWHLMSNAEWAAIAHWCRKNGTMPRGNNNFGHDFTAKHETALMAPGNSSQFTPEGRTLTGTGPVSWSHDGSAAGICDLNGNVWDFVAGLRILDGEIQVIPDNDSALNVDESATSTYWKAIDPEGKLVAPGSPGTLKYDGVNPGNADPASAIVPGGVKLDTVVRHPQYTGEDKVGNHGYTIMPFKDLAAESGLTPPLLLKELGLFPVAADLNENLFVRNTGERIALRGGSWFDGPTAGLWELYLRDGRSFIFPDIGFRAAFVEL
jgi:formylglycine-generating enzyme